MSRDYTWLIGNKHAVGSKPNKTSFRKGLIPWNKGKKIYTNKQKKQISERMKKLYTDPRNHPKWKGDMVGYCGVHDWLDKL